MITQCNPNSKKVDLPSHLFQIIEIDAWKEFHLKLYVDGLKKCYPNFCGGIQNFFRISCRTYCAPKNKTIIKHHLRMF